MSCAQMIGWAYDESTVQRIEVHIWLETTAGVPVQGFNLGRTNVSRADVNNAFNIPLNRGFSYTSGNDHLGLFAAMNGKTYRVRAHAIGENFLGQKNGDNPVIRTVTLSC